MAPQEVKQSESKPKRGLTPSGLKLLVMVLAASCGAVLLAVARPVAPREMPTLRIERDAIEAARRAHRRAAERAPSGEAVERFRRLYAQQGKAEASAQGEPARKVHARLEALRNAIETIRKRHGERGRRALRAEMVGRVDDALEGHLGAERKQAVLGSFPTMLGRYGLVRDGERVAPGFVVRTLYKARWNAICNLELTQGFRDVERQAYWGWLALHAPAAPMTRRRKALARYRAAGGQGVAEARGVLAFAQGRWADAAAALEKAYRARDSLRLRNHHLAALAEGERGQASPARGGGRR